MAVNKDDFPAYTTSSTNVNVTGPGAWFVASATSGSATVTLPPRSSIPVTDLPIYWISCLSSADPAIVTRSSTDTFNVGGSGSTTSFVLPPGESVAVMHNGLQWIPIFGGSPAAYRKVKSVSATTQTLDRSASLWTFTGASATTWTLPDRTKNTGLEYIIKNKGTADITVQRAGSDNLYTTAAVTSITITAGNSVQIVNDGAHWSVV